MREPLSQNLAHLLEAGAGVPTFNQLLERTRGRGHLLFILLLCLPFLLPMPVPGVSTLAGLVVMFTGARIALGHSPRLPPWLGRRSLPSGFGPKAVSGVVRVMRLLERFIRPRGARWIAWRPVRFVNGAFLVLLGFLLALPIPPVIFFTNTFPAIGIIVIAGSIIEEDGIMLWVGYALAVFATLYLIVIGGVVHLLVSGLLAWLFGGNPT